MPANVAQRERAGLLRRARTFDAAQGVRVRIDDRELLNFCSNDYLGLAQDRRIIEAMQKAANECGVGSTAAHLVCGHRREHAQLEEALCEWTGRDAALLFSSGWLANLGAMQALLDRDDVCVQDKLNHASLLDAVAARRRHAEALSRTTTPKPRRANSPRQRTNLRWSRPTACSAWMATWRRCANWPHCANMKAPR